MYNLKDKIGMQKFKELTSNDDFLSSVFKEEGKIEIQTKLFLKRLDYCIRKCFNKIRVTKSKKNHEVDKLFEMRRSLKNKVDEISVNKLKEVENKLSEMCAEENVAIINEACAGLTCEGGGVNAGKLWSLKKKLQGTTYEPPTAMLDQKGNLVTTKSTLEKLTIDVYTNRLKPNKIKDSLKVHEVQQEELWKKRLKEAQGNITPDWTMDDLDTVLKQLKNNKSRDPMGFTNELFKPECAGEDMKKAVLKMSNCIKKQQVFPKALGLCNITSLYKKKGLKKDFDSYRGIFRVTAIRSILDKLIYNDEYETIDSNLTDSNVGARRNRNIRENIFVINAITNNVRRRNLRNTDIQIYDAEKCFDKLWANECYNDAYENGLRNDKLALLYNINKTAQVGVKTSTGITDKIMINDNIMQGTVWGSLLCTSTVSIFVADQCTKRHNKNSQPKSLDVFDKN